MADQYVTIEGSGIVFTEPVPPGRGISVYDVISPPPEGLLWPPRVLVGK